MSNPAAAPVLGAAGAALGGPLAGGLIGNLAGQFSQASPSNNAPYASPLPQPQIVSVPSSPNSGLGTGSIIAIAGGVLAVVLVLVLTMKKR